MNNFYKFIRDGKIANLNYPVRGCYPLTPHGKGILNNLASKIISSFVELGYEEVTLPNIIPANFIAHLDSDKMFKVIKRDSKSEFYLNASSEMTSANLAKMIIQSYKDLPFRTLVVSNNFRNEHRNALIKNLEFESWELNSFFENIEEAQKDLNKINNAFETYLKKIKIYYLKLKKNADKNSPTIFYAYFPFSGYWGSIFWSNILSDYYVEKNNCYFTNRSNKKQLPVHLNAGFTSRIFAAYLANHLDDWGFVLPGGIATYSVFLHQTILDDLQSAKIIEELRIYNIKTFIEKGNIKNAYQKFLMMGVPVFVLPRKEGYKIIRRIDQKEKVVSAEELVQQIRNFLEAEESSEIKSFEDMIIRSNSPSKIKELEEKGYVILGYSDNSVIMAEKVY